MFLGIKVAAIKQIPNHSYFQLMPILNFLFKCNKGDMQYIVIKDMDQHLEQVMTSIFVTTLILLTAVMYRKTVTLIKMVNKL